MRLPPFPPRIKPLTPGPFQQQIQHPWNVHVRIEPSLIAVPPHRVTQMTQTPGVGLGGEEELVGELGEIGGSVSEAGGCGED
mmetsp:Transcript_13746/g.13918  ORF Transcript_13746/g.13918 Transcript_13746/m.13918 type:complete len:82 (+) Transcript_13746:527-772(+)|eukprot:CAMPEP_0171320272 /NCGR_PEP_ID=MMETSP0816-20121228/102970_1 /TAXON_ID=420281 /ORGANISM="Proboscia inermis, Strain CCAP1064/1" /LENGTH=81 /DNA_ID=CAMNT_0011816917 /DNA_START=43 /DNA_END=285 /DNA_ORIENTATION=+